MTAAQLFSASVYDKQHVEARKEAAKACSAELVDMQTLERHQNALEEETGSEEECVALALAVAREGGRVLFVGGDAKRVTKRLAAVSTRDVGTDTAAQWLHCVRFRPSRSVYELLGELDRVQNGQQPALGSEPRIQLVVIGPLCDLFAAFQSASGLTATGSGLKRMVELATKRLRAITSTRVVTMEPDTIGNM